MIKTTVGDILNSDSQLVVNIVNCDGVFVDPFSNLLEKTYPGVHKEYVRYIEELKMREMVSARYRQMQSIEDMPTMQLRLGSIQFTNVTNTKTIVNLFAQKSSNIFEETIDYDALETAMTTLFDVAKEHNYSIGIPYGLGCDYGCGDWNTVKALINKIFYEYDGKLTIYKLSL